MARINFSFDTNAKTFAADIDGVAVENCVGIDCSPSWDDETEFRCVLMTAKKDHATEITTVTRMFASKSVAASESLKSRAGVISTSHPGWVEERTAKPSKAASDIASFYKKTGK